MNNLPPEQTPEFYIVALEPGAEHPSIPTWACELDNPARLEPGVSNNIQRTEVDSVPGAFQLLNVVSHTECTQLVEITESLGYLQDAAVSLPRSIRHNDSLTWVADRPTTDIIWQRCAALINHSLENFNGKRALGLNARFRFYRYQQGDYFSPHTDGSWPGSQVIDRELVTNAFEDRWSQLTFLLYLSDDYEGGSTQFFIDGDLTSVVNIKTPAGGVLCFPHGMHPMHCLHSSEVVTLGIKYIIRSDVLFEL